MALAQLIVKVGADISGVTKGLKDVETKMQGFSKKMDAIGGKMKSWGTTMSTFITLPVAAAGAASFRMASDYQESLNKVNVAFGENANQVKNWSQTTLKQFGIAKGTALDMAAKYGDMATGMGLNTSEAADMSTALVGLAGDLASFKNIGIDIADTALTSIFTGETESLKQLGIVMTQTNLEEFALSKGIKTKIKDMTQAEQVQLRYAYVTAMSKNSIGDFARTSDGAANQMRIFSESMKELGASFGENLLPVITPLIQSLNSMVQKFGALSPASKKIITVLALVVAAIGPLLIGLGMLASGIAAISAALPILGGFFAALAGPVGIAIAIIGGLVVAGVLLYKNWDKVKAFGVSMWEAIKTQWNNSAVILKNAMREAGQGIIEVWGKIKGAILEAVAAALQFVGATDKAAAVQYEADKAKYIGLADTGKQGGRRGNQSLFGYNAQGTDYWKGGLSWVGEQGPELVNLPRGAQVLSNRDSMGMMGGTVNHTGTIRVEGVNSMGQLMGATELIASELSKETRRWPSKTAALPSRA